MRLITCIILLKIISSGLLKKDWFGLLIVVIFSGAIIALLRPAFLSSFNLYVLMVSTSYMLIIALAQMIIISIGQMNLSVGAIGGLVAITAEPLMPSPIIAIIVGGIGGAIVVFGSLLLIRMQFDDVVGAIPVHMFAGIWGTLAVVISNTEVSLGAQVIGILAVNIFVFVTSFIVWSILKSTIGIRISEEAEKEGTDKVEIGVTAYMIRD